MTRPRLLDLFCGAGGASMGYSRAGFEVVGVDIAPQPNYPFEFVQMDALAALALLSAKKYAGVHASPPCQGYMRGSTSTGDKYPRLIEPVRQMLRALGVPYVIENIVPARPHLLDPITLCGEMFGLDVIRHRLFETSFGAVAPHHPKHRGRVRGWRHGEYFDGPYVAVYGKGGGKASLSEAQAAMGIEWIDDYDAIVEAIPPAYTEFVGTQLMNAMAEPMAAS